MWRNRMNYQELVNYHLLKPGAIVDYPFGEKIVVLKISNKMFSLVSRTEEGIYINLKCDPDLALALRHQYSSVREGYHMNKKHWNTIFVDGSIPDNEIKKMIDHSYDLVFSKLKKTEKEFLLCNY